MNKSADKPKVLLLGNGINRAFAKNPLSWRDLLAKAEYDKDLENCSHLTMPMEIVLRTGDNVDGFIKSNNKEFYGEVDCEEYREILQEILLMGFDHILTTNYSYELESAALQVNSLTDHRLESIQKHTRGVQKAEGSYMLHTYNEVSFQDRLNKIWHIHGEARKPSSIILGHYYYGNLLYRYQDLLKKRKNGYSYGRYRDKDKINSWIDAFILGDVYILGFGFDLSEADLWWLLNRKKREKADHGGTFFFEPAKGEFDERLELLKAYDVQVIDLDMTIHPGGETSSDEERTNTYKAFYKTALDRIRNSITKGEE